jgi:hypothetical protein
MQIGRGDMPRRNPLFSSTIGDSQRRAVERVAKPCSQMFLESDDSANRGKIN